MKENTDNRDCQPLKVRFVPRLHSVNGFEHATEARSPKTPQDSPKTTTGHVSAVPQAG